MLSATVNSAPANSVNRHMKKNYKCYFLAIACSLSVLTAYADEYVWGEPFKEGDTVSAETFNQIFDTIQKLNQTVKDDDLVGSWKCNAMTTRDTTGWIKNGSFYLLEGAQINFMASSGVSSSESAYEVSTSSPSPLKRITSSFFGSYQLYENMMFLTQNSDPNARIYSVDLVSPSRIEMTFLETSATSFPASFSSFLSCESTAVIPSPPSSPSISQDGFSVSLDWTDNSEDEDGFKIYRRASSELAALEIATTAASTYIDSDVLDAETYFYNVSAFTADRESAKSNIVSATIDSIAPVVVTTFPSADQTVARDDRNVSFTFSEKVEVFCPDDLSLGSQGPAMFCPSGDGAITGTILVNGNLRSITGGHVANGFGGTLTLSLTMAGSAERLDANQTVSLTVSSAFIKDVNGNAMEADYFFQFQIGDYVNNPNCPPSC